MLEKKSHDIHTLESIFNGSCTVNKLVNKRLNFINTLKFFSPMSRRIFAWTIIKWQAKAICLESIRLDSPVLALLNEICNKGLKAYLLPDTEGGDSHDSNACEQ